MVSLPCFSPYPKMDVMAAYNNSCTPACLAHNKPVNTSSNMRQGQHMQALLVTTQSKHQLSAASIGVEHGSKLQTFYVGMDGTSSHTFGQI